MDCARVKELQRERAPSLVAEGWRSCISTKLELKVTSVSKSL
jgi:hypothetical protein